MAFSSDSELQGCLCGLPSSAVSSEEDAAEAGVEAAEDSGALQAAVEAPVAEEVVARWRNRGKYMLRWLQNYL